MYGCGEVALLDQGGLAIVGSRHVDDELMAYTESVGRLAASARRTVISGGAKGIDRAAMHGAIQAGGAVAGVMADSLERAALARDNREPLMEQTLVLISPYDPAAGFNVGNAMQRNKVIYALSDAALVVTSDFEKGGTWAGAIEQLEKLRFVPVFVRNGAGAGKGNSALLQRGARPWPNPSDKAELTEALSAALEAVAAEPRQEALSFTPSEKMPAREAKPDPQPVAQSTEVASNGDAATRDGLLLKLAGEAMKESEIAKRLGLGKSETKALLIDLIREGLVKKHPKPVRYSVISKGELLL